jgi:hypothetical protein
MSRPTLQINSPTGSSVAQHAEQIIEPLSLDGRNTAPTKEKKVKCGCCKAKLGGVAMTCKCGIVFCINHLGDHGCTFDHRLAANAMLTRQLDNKGLANKLEKI